MTATGVGTIIDCRVRVPHDRRPRDEEMPADIMDQLDAVVGFGSTRFKTSADLLSDMDVSGVDIAVVHAEYEFGDPADGLNEAVASMLDENPNRFVGFGTISMNRLRIRRAINQVEGLKRDGMKGVSIQPSFFDMALDERRLYPIYSKLEELGLVVALHTGVNYSRLHPIANDHPLKLDQVACDFPDLKIVACHGAWPWTTELVAVARKHPTVFIEFGGLAPKYVGAENTGWGVMYRFMNSLLRDQILFGTDWPVFSMGRAVEEWRELGELKPEVLSALLGENANRLLGLEKELHKSE